jgi:hypothetical protein
MRFAVLNLFLSSALWTNERPGAAQMTTKIVLDGLTDDEAWALAEMVERMIWDDFDRLSATARSVMLSMAPQSSYGARLPKQDLIRDGRDEWDSGSRSPFRPQRLLACSEAYLMDRSANHSAIARERRNTPNVR